MNRFLLWGLASLASAAAIWSINIPRLLSSEAVQMSDPSTKAALLATAVFGNLTIGLYWLTFFPPNWYRKRHAAPAELGSTS